MQVQVVRRKDNLIVRLKGEFDHHTSSIFRRAVEKELKKEIVKNLIINVENLTFMDSSGIGVILGRYKEVTSKGGKVVICGSNKHIKKILQLGGVLNIIPIFSDENKAIASVS